MFGIERKDVALMELVRMEAENRLASRGLTEIEAVAESETALDIAEIKRLRLTIWVPLRNKHGRTST